MDILVTHNIENASRTNMDNPDQSLYEAFEEKANSYARRIAITSAFRSNMLFTEFLTDVNRD